MKPFIIECGIIHNRLQALVYLLSLKWLPPVDNTRSSGIGQILEYEEWCTVTAKVWAKNGVGPEIDIY